MGENCTVYAGVIIGKNVSDDKKPMIGNNVNISIEAKIIGGVKIGDNSIIAPNSVVVKDVAPNSVGSVVPARILSQKWGKSIFVL